ncbi:DUF3347 domain-containing protein [Salinimicrobium gaetbulicola]|uniref:DUF3347 domain-containing protein n=1 Tax=Salinimicrobium gaetbulicola TaxID=999702 RepID=A0ABW3IHX3_9FLAO
MKNARLLLMAFLGAITLNSCGDSKKENEAEDATHADHEMHMEGEEMHEMSQEMDHSAMTAEMAFKDEKMAAVYGHYDHIKTALVKSDAAEAQNGGKMLVDALQAAGGKEDAMSAAQKIAQSSELNEQRTAFSDLSSAVEEMMAGTLSSGAIYKQYCPMAFEGKGGYWLSSSEEIRNPYYGDKMLKCGSVRDTIK